MAVNLSNSFRKVAGNFAAAAIGNIGMPKKIPAFADVEFGLGRRGRNKTENLAYPLNVESDPQQGHYIIFEILEQNKATLAAAKLVKSVTGQANAIIAQSGSPKVENSIVDTFGNLGTAAYNAAQSSYKDAAISKGQRGASNGLQVSKKATTAMKVQVALYMPPSVQVSYGAKYGETTIGVVSEAIDAGIRAFMAEGGSLAGALGTAAGGMTTGALNYVKDKVIPAIPGMEGADAIFAINRGSIITPRMELMFEGIQRRDFSFNFMFLPKSEPEAEVVEQIVKKFKYHMASNYGTGGLGGVDGVREMEIPDFFNIKYMHQSHKDHNPHLNLIKQCVLTKTDVEYGSDRYKSYAGGRPQTTKLSLSFQELEIITKDYIDEGY